MTKALSDTNAAFWRSLTMCSPEVFDDNMELCWRHRHVKGAVVECGVWRGGMVGAIIEMLLQEGERHAILCDSWQGLPPAQKIDGPAAMKWQGNNPVNCSDASAEHVEELIKLTTSQYTILKGWFSETLPKIQEPIAILRLDADWYASTRTCLENLFNQVVPGGLIIVDDYYVWEGCSRAVHEFLSERCAVERIRCMGDVAYMVKQ